MLPSTSTFSMSNAALHNHGISVSSSLHNTAATPTGPSNPESALTIGGSTGGRPRTSSAPVTALDPRTTGSLTLPQRADHTAVPELEGQSRHEDEDSRPPSTRTCQEPPAPTSSQDAMTRTTGLASPSEFTPAQKNCLKTGSSGYLRPTLCTPPTETLPEPR